MKSGDRLNQIEPLIAEMLIKLDETAAKVDRVSNDVAELKVSMRRNSETLDKHTDILVERSENVSFLLENQLLMNGKIDKMDKKLEYMDTRLDSINEKFISIDEKFEHVEQKFDRVDERFDGVDKKFDRVDKRFDEIGTRFNAITEKFDGIDGRLDKMDNNFNEIKRRFIDNENTQQEIKVVQESILTLLKNKN